MELDYSEIHNSRKIRETEQAESMEDRRFREIITKGQHKNTDGNWEAPLPFKTVDVLLPDSKGHCLRRLLSLKRDVNHPQKPDEIRIVFDCSPVYKNKSLNKHLLQGKDQLNSLIGVLTRFRKEKVALTCNIEQMFHSFYVNPNDRDYLRFLWF